MLRTDEQNKRFRALMATLGLDEEAKKHLVKSWSNDRTESSAEMTQHEMQALIDYLQSQVPVTENTDKADKMRKKLIGLLRELGYEKFDQRKAKMVADMQRIKGWVIKHGYLHKDFNAYSEKELPKLVTQAQEYWNSEMKKV